MKDVFVKDDLKESLRHMQSHPTTGTAHNQQVISTQVETIFMLDNLKTEIERLRHTIISLDKQNWRLGIVVALLTVVTVVLAVVQTISTFACL